MHTTGTPLVRFQFNAGPFADSTAMLVCAGTSPMTCVLSTCTVHVNDTDATSWAVQLKAAVAAGDFASGSSPAQALIGGVVSCHDRPLAVLSRGRLIPLLAVNVIALSQHHACEGVLGTFSATKPAAACLDISWFSCQQYVLQH